MYHIYILYTYKLSVDDVVLYECLCILLAMYNLHYYRIMDTVDVSYGYIVYTDLILTYCECLHHYILLHLGFKNILVSV